MIQRLELIQFRNHSRIVYEPTPGWNIITGANGRGKSSLLEAAYYLGRLKSYRTGLARDLVKWEQGGFSAHAVLRSGRELAVRWASRQRQCLVDGLAVERAEEFWGLLPVVLMCHEDQNLVKGGATLRLQWLDSLVTLHDRSHLNRMQRYNHVVKQRNAWLKQGAQDRRLGSNLTQQLLELGHSITKERYRCLGAMQGHLAAVRDVILPERRLELTYEPNLEPVGDAPVSHVAPTLLAREMQQGRSLVGPHRDELTLWLDGRNTGRHGSEGEQRLIALLWRLLEVQQVRSATGVEPLLLLDDVMSPLDYERRSLWLQQLAPAADVWVTAVSLEGLARGLPPFSHWQLETESRLAQATGIIPPVV